MATNEQRMGFTWSQKRTDNKEIFKFRKNNSGIKCNKAKKKNNEWMRKSERTEFLEI